MVGHKRERVLGRVGRAVNAAARDFAREAAQLENGGGREAAAERLVVSWSSSFAQCPASTQSHIAIPRVGVQSEPDCVFIFLPN